MATYGLAEQSMGFTVCTHEFSIQLASYWATAPCKSESTIKKLPPLVELIGGAGVPSALPPAQPLKKPAGPTVVHSKFKLMSCQGAPTSEAALSKTQSPQLLMSLYQMTLLCAKHQRGAVSKKITRGFFMKCWLCGGAGFSFRFGQKCRDGQS